MNFAFLLLKKEKKFEKDKILTSKNNRTVEYFLFRNNNDLKKNKNVSTSQNDRMKGKKKKKERNVRRDIEEKKLKTFLTDRRVG